ncbi:MAG: COG1361 S-layer family protein [Candidatus Aenigmatarchaeota archaeon]
MNKYKCICILSVFFLLISITPGLAFAASDNSPNIKISLLKYTPYPAEPGNYVTLTLKVENTGNGDANVVKLKLVTEYPFSFDSNTTVKIENSAISLPLDSNMIVSLGKIPASEYTLIEYRVRIAGDILEGNAQLKLWQQTQTSDTWILGTFNIFVQGTDKLEVADVIPSILTPGKLTDVIFVLNNSGTASIRNVIFTWSEKDNKILPLGSGNKKYVDSIDSHGSVEIPFTLVADPSATSGAYTLNTNMSYTIGGNISKSLNINVGMFIGGSADFDVSVQDSQTGTVSLSIANVGSNPTTSVSVKIPEQENFIVSGASSSFLGNLNPGDFTLASFQITARSMNTTFGSGQMPRNTNFSGGQYMPRNTTLGGNQNMLKIEIYYTDTNSNRQIIKKEIPMSSQSMTRSQLSSMQSGQYQRQSNSGLNLIIIGIAGIIIVVVLIKYHRKIGNLIKKIKK